MKIISSLLAQAVKDAAEGKYGAGVKSVYWALAGKKTLVAIGLTALYGIGQVAVATLGSCVPECGTPEALAQLQAILDYFPNIVAFLVAVGLFDAAVRLDPPKK